MKNLDIYIYNCDNNIWKFWQKCYLRMYRILVPIFSNFRLD